MSRPARRSAPAGAAPLRRSARGLKGRAVPSFCVVAAIVALLGAPSAARRPNIVLIVADDLGYGELGCQGNAQIPTPQIDSLARNGVRMTDGYVTAPYCAPSRAGLLSGRNQARFGFHRNPTRAANLDPRAGLPLGVPTLAERLRRLGYATGLVGKWHLGATAAHHPQQRGFDEFYGFLHEGHYYAPTDAPGVRSLLRIKASPPGLPERWTEGNVTYSCHMNHDEPPYDRDNPILDGRRVVAEHEFLTDAWAHRAEQFIDRHCGRPFFLVLAYNAPHSPMQATDLYLQRFAAIEDFHRRMFAAMVAHLDDSVGRVLAALRRADIERDTLIVFLSDNGGPTRELTSSNAPLSGGKGSLLEGGIRVPMLVQWTGRLPAATVFRHPVSSLDIVPTALDAAGAAPEGKPAVGRPTTVVHDQTAAEQDLDGVSLLPFLSGRRTGEPHDVLYWHYGPECALRSGDWKLLRRRSDDRPRLYHLATDIAETRDLADEQPERYAALNAKLDAWLAATDAEAARCDAEPNQPVARPAP